MLIVEMRLMRYENLGKLMPISYALSMLSSLKRERKRVWYLFVKANRVIDEYLDMLDQLSMGKSKAKPLDTSKNPANRTATHIKAS